MKPHIRIIAGRPVTQYPKTQEARAKFGQPFCHEPGATWKPKSTPFLTEWLATRKASGR